jgi:hypothetical protein
MDVHRWVVNPYIDEPNFTEADISFTHKPADVNFMTATISFEDFFALYHLLNDSEKKVQTIDRDLISGEYLKRLGADPKLVYDTKTQEMEDQVFIISSIIEDYYNVQQK